MNRVWLHRWSRPLTVAATAALMASAIAVGWWADHQTGNRYVMGRLLGIADAAFFSLATASIIALAPAVWHQEWHRTGRRSAMERFILGIFLAALSIEMLRGYAILWRGMGRPDWNPHPWGPFAIGVGVWGWGLILSALSAVQEAYMTTKAHVRIGAYVFVWMMISFGLAWALGLESFIF